MLIEVGWFFANLMLVVFRIMTTIKGPEPFPHYTMNVLCLLDLFILAHNHDIRLDQTFLEPINQSDIANLRLFDCVTLEIHIQTESSNVCCADIACQQ